MSRPAMRAVAAATLAAALAACVPGMPFDEVITLADQSSAYSAREIAAFAAAGPAVELRGPLPGGAAPEAVIAALRLPGYLPQTPFAPAPDPPLSGRQARFVLVFGPRAGLDPDAICRGEVDGGPQGPGLGVAAVFCRGPSPFGWARLDHARPLTPGEPAFGAALTRLFAAAAPRRNPNDPQRDDGNACIIMCG